MQAQRVSLVNSIKIFKAKIISILHKVFPKIMKEKTFPNSFYEASIALMSNSGKNIYRKISLMDIYIQRNP